MVVVRHWPAVQRVESLLQSLTREDAHLFLHGDAVALAEPGRLPALAGRPRLEVCAASWQRRYRYRPDSRFGIGSLVPMYQSLDDTGQYRAWGRGGASAWRRGSGPAPAWLLEVAAAPVDARDRLETLEFVLGAAAIGLNARVLFCGSGYNHLLTDAARGWAQLTDFDLLELIAEVPDGLNPELPVRQVDAAGARALRDSDHRRLVL